MMRLRCWLISTSVTAGAVLASLAVTPCSAATLQRGTSAPTAAAPAARPAQPLGSPSSSNRQAGLQRSQPRIGLGGHGQSLAVNQGRQPVAPPAAGPGFPPCDGRIVGPGRPAGGSGGRLSRTPQRPPAQGGRPHLPRRGSGSIGSPRQPAQADPYHGGGAMNPRQRTRGPFGPGTVPVHTTSPIPTGWGSTIQDTSRPSTTTGAGAPVGFSQAASTMSQWTISTSPRSPIRNPTATM